MQLQISKFKTYLIVYSEQQAGEAVQQQKVRPNKLNLLTLEWNKYFFSEFWSKVKVLPKYLCSDGLSKDESQNKKNNSKTNKKTRTKHYLGVFLRNMFPLESGDSSQAFSSIYHTEPLPWYPALQSPLVPCPKLLILLKTVGFSDGDLPWETPFYKQLLSPSWGWRMILYLGGHMTCTGEFLRVCEVLLCKFIGVNWEYRKVAWIT